MINSIRGMLFHEDEPRVRVEVGGPLHIMCLRGKGCALRYFSALEDVISICPKELW